MVEGPVDYASASDPITSWSPVVAGQTKAVSSDCS